MADGREEWASEEEEEEEAGGGQNGKVKLRNAAAAAKVSPTPPGRDDLTLFFPFRQIGSNEGV